MSSQTVQLTLKAKSLKNRGGGLLSLGTSDPFAVVTLIHPLIEDEEPTIVGQTEVVRNNLNPTWVTKFDIEFCLSNPVSLLISIYDHDEKDGNHKPMGSVMFTVGAILGCRGNVSAKTLRNSEGTVYAHIEKSDNKQKFKLQLRGAKLKNVEDGMFTKSDPFYEISKRLPSSSKATSSSSSSSSNGDDNDEWLVVHRSEHVKNNLNPIWNPTLIELRTISSGDPNEVIKLSLWDHESSGDHKFIGSVDTSVEELMSARQFGSVGDGGNHDFALLLQDRKGKSAGSIFVLNADVTGGTKTKLADDEDRGEEPVQEIIEEAETEPEPPTFVDYISGGCELALSVGIDFTGSNGDPRVPGTLHYISQEEHNDYEKAIIAIGSILLNYDKDKQCPVWGFGAKFEGVVRHIFQCGAGDAVGVKGIIDNYHSVFPSGIILSRPTVITEVLKYASKRASDLNERAKFNGTMAYSILLVLTDGSVSDFDATAQVLEEVSDTPLSVIIVGLGSEDFSGMKELVSRGFGRDFVRFVEFNECAGNKHALTTSTVGDLPDQVVDYFISRSIMPPDNQVAEDNDVEVSSPDDVGGDDDGYDPSKDIEVKFDAAGFMKATRKPNAGFFGKGVSNYPGLKM